MQHCWLVLQLKIESALGISAKAGVLVFGNFEKPPFVLSKLFTRKLKGGIEKQGSGVVGWLLPLQLWGKVGMGGVVAGIAPIPAFLAGRAFPCMGMPFGKRGVYAAKPLPHPRRRGKEPARKPAAYQWKFGAV